MWDDVKYHTWCLVFIQTGSKEHGVYMGKGRKKMNEVT